MLALVLERLAHAERADTVVVTTSDGPEDDPVAGFCAAHGAPVFRGGLDDVAGRLYAAARSHGHGVLVRVSGDSPFLDQALVDEAIRRYEETGAEIVTNVHPERTFPPGQSVELLELSALRRGLELMTEPGDREHVTPAIYRHAGRFRIEPLRSGGERPAVHLTVDAPEDAARAEAVLQRMERPHWQYGWREVVALAET
jgi:spore coat polysaccharide biosynthesis protein SpsF (cytidylyltransferase family)